jgi:hypothetical protein
MTTRNSRTCLHHGVLCGSWRCLHTETCVFLLEMSTLRGPELHRGVSTLKRPVLLWTCLHYKWLCCTCTWTCLHHRGRSFTLTCLHCRGLPFFWRCLHYRSLSCIWTCLRYRSLCCTWTCLHHKGPEQHLDLSTLQRAVQPGHVQLGALLFETKIFIEKCEKSVFWCVTKYSKRKRTVFVEAKWKIWRERSEKKRKNRSEFWKWTSETHAKGIQFLFISFISETFLSETGAP